MKMDLKLRRLARSNMKAGASGIPGEAKAAKKVAAIGERTIYVRAKTVSEANTSSHWAARHRRFKEHAKAIDDTFLEHRIPRQLSRRVVVTLIRIGVRRLDDDNLRGALKGVRDAVARWFGVDDGGEWIRWEYSQRQDPSKGAWKYAVVVEVKDDDSPAGVGAGGEGKGMRKGKL